MDKNVASLGVITVYSAGPTTEPIFKPIRADSTIFARCGGQTSGETTSCERPYRASICRCSESMKA